MIMRIYAHGKMPSLRPLCNIRNGRGKDSNQSVWSVTAAVIAVAPDNYLVKGGTPLPLGY